MSRRREQPVPKDNEADAVTAQIRAELMRAGLLPPDPAPPPPRQRPPLPGPAGALLARKPSGKNVAGLHVINPGILSVGRFLASFLVPVLIVGLAALLFSLFG